MLSEVAGFAFVARGKDDHLSDASAASSTPAPASRSVPAATAIRSMVRSLYNCSQIPVESEDLRCRVIVATHPAGKKKSPIGVTRAGIVYELFTREPAATLLHGLRRGGVVRGTRGAYAPTLSDEDREQDED